MVRLGKVKLWDLGKNDDDEKLCSYQGFTDQTKNQKLNKLLKSKPEHIPSFYTELQSTSLLPTPPERVREKETEIERGIERSNKNLTLFCMTQRQN